jgi:Permeases of the drug/metabolite transporter (DMT) superfamily
MKPKCSSTRLANLSLLLISLIWGSGFIATEMAIRAGVDVTAITALRFLIAALIMLPMQFKRLKLITRKQLRTGFIAGTLLGLAFLAQTYGQAHSSVSSCALITATNVIMVPFIGWAFTRKRPSLKTGILALFTLIGMAILTYQPGSGSIVFSHGDFFVLLCAFLYALHISYLGIASREIDSRLFTFLQMIFAGLIAFLFLPFTYTGQSINNLLEGFLPILYLAVFSTCLCFYIQTSAQKKTSAAKTAIILSTEGLFGALFSVALGLENFTWQMGVGGVIIISCVILTEANFKAKKEMP